MVEPAGEATLASGDKSAADQQQVPEAASVFIAVPEGLPESMESPFWQALPLWGEFKPLGGYAPVPAATRLHLAHDAHQLAVLFVSEEPDMEGIWATRRADQGRLDLDECVEILLDPQGTRTSCWTVRVTPTGQCETLPPPGGIVPECKVEIRKETHSWSVLLRIPFAQLGLAGELRGTPVDGEVWGVGFLRRRREAVSGQYAGLREVAGWAVACGPTGTFEPIGHLRFQGGRKSVPVRLAKPTNLGFGVNEICLEFEDGKLPEGVEVELQPPPSARLRSKDCSRFKFRLAKPGVYRYSVRIPYRPPDEPTEEEIAAIEAEAGRELSEEELAEILAKRTGTPEYVAGLSSRLEDTWSEVEELEQELGRLEQELARVAPDEDVSDFGKAVSEFRAVLDKIDSFRSPHAKGKLPLGLLDELRNLFADSRQAARSRLLQRGSISVASPYLESGNWYLGALRVRTDHSEGTMPAAELAGRLRGAGLHFAAFADLCELGDQDGDGLHDWNGDGTVAGPARRIEGSRRAIRQDRGREAYIRDYSRTAAEQGKPWVTEDWKLSKPGEFVVLRAAEVGAHLPALCIGLKCGGLPPRAWETYEAVHLAQSAGGIAALCDGGQDLLELPLELSTVLGLDAPQETWERFLFKGRRMLLFPGTKLDGKDLVDGKLPERAHIVGVLASDLTEEAIVAALRRGSFYVTTATGPRIIGIEAKGDTLTIRTEKPCQVLFKGEQGKVLGGAFGTEATYKFTGREKFVRAVCLADVLPDGFRLEALTQAFYLSDDLPRSPLGEADSIWTVTRKV